MAKYTFELRELFTPIKFNPPIFTRDEVEGFFKDYELSDYLTNVTHIISYGETKDRIKEFATLNNKDFSILTSSSPIFFVTFISQPFNRKIIGSSFSINIF